MGLLNVTVTRHGDETAEGLVREALYDVGRVEKAQKGLLLREVLSSTEGKKYQETENTVATVVLAEPAGGGRVAWGRIERTEVSAWEGSDEPRTVRTDFAYDDYGHRTATFAWGEVVGDDLLFGDDERITRTTLFRRYRTLVDGAADRDGRRGPGHAASQARELL